MAQVVGLELRLVPVLHINRFGSHTKSFC
jgi:hypothetical protein